MKIFLDKSTILLLQSYSTIYKYISSTLTKSFFRITNKTFTVFFRGTLGAFKTTLDLTEPEEINDVSYYSVDYFKWQNALIKFEGYDGIHLEIKKNLLKLWVDDCSDVINLAVITYTNDSNDAKLLESFIEDQKSINFTENTSKHFIFPNDVITNMQLVTSLFLNNSINTGVNSIGLSKNNLIYADRVAIVKLTHEIPFDDNLFIDEYINIHTFTANLITLLSKLNNNVLFNNDYGTIYWEDDNNKLCLASDIRRITIPDEETCNGILPNPDNQITFSVALPTLKEGIDFFNGFYEGTNWKPITFNVIANKEVSLYYKHPTTEVTKVLQNAISDGDGTFMIDSELLKKIINKAKDKFIDNPDTQAIFTFDNESAGIHCTIEDKYDIIFGKFLDDTI